VGGCTTTTSFRYATGLTSRHLILTNSSHTFVAWIAISEDPNTVYVRITTTEPAVGGAFKDRFPVTTQLARVVLGPIISARIFDQ